MPSTTRRDFALALAAAPLGAAPAAEKEPEAADAVLALLRARFGKHLTEVQWEAVATKVRGGSARAADLRKQPLRNSDDPAFAFRADLP